MNNYIDSYGRYHSKPVTDSNPYPTNNGYIYSFYADVVGLPVDIKGDAFSDLNQLDTTVLSRHPGIRPPDVVATSHDEYVGAAGLDQIYAADIVEFGESNYWQFCDIPGFTPIPFRKLVIDDVMAAYEDLANEDHPRTAVIKYPVIYPIAFWHRPEQQYFYYRCAGRSPGIGRTLYFIFATIVSIFKKDKRNPMLGFKFLKFKKLGPTLIERGLSKLVDRYSKWKEACINYFPEDHPILEKIKELYV